MSFSGKLRCLVDIEAVTESRDAYTGEVTESWAAVHSDVPASITSLSVKDYLQSRAAQSEVTARVMIRYISGLNDEHRIVGQCDCHSGKIYNPEGWLEDDKTGLNYLTAPCSEGVNQG